MPFFVCRMGAAVSKPTCFDCGHAVLVWQCRRCNNAFCAKHRAAHSPDRCMYGRDDKWNEHGLPVNCSFELRKSKPCHLPESIALSTLTSNFFGACNCSRSMTALSALVFDQVERSSTSKAILWNIWLLSLQQNVVTNSFSKSGKARVNELDNFRVPVSHFGLQIRKKRAMSSSARLLVSLCHWQCGCPPPKPERL
jgi:hypothetical protein